MVRKRALIVWRESTAVTNAADNNQEGTNASGAIGIGRIVVLVMLAI